MTKRSVPIGSNPRLPIPLDVPSGATAQSRDQELRLAMAAQRERALGLGCSAIAAILANSAQVLPIRYPAALSLLAVGLASTLAFAWVSRRARRVGGQICLVSWWVPLDVILITAAVPFTGGIESPWWIWYLACAGTAAVHLGPRFAIVGAGMTAFLYLGVLVAIGAIHGADHALYLALSRLVFLGGASFALLVNTRRLRESRATVHCLHLELTAKARELERLNGDLQEFAIVQRDLTWSDSLTGLRNRRYFEQMIEGDRAKRGLVPFPGRRARSLESGCGLLMLDLDHFKAINDEWGHAVGDRALKHLAQVLLGCLRKADSVVRWAGDEFVVLVDQLTVPQVIQVAEKISSTLRSQPFKMSATTSKVLTVSIGWAFLDQEGRERGLVGWDEALIAADGALYAAKRDGRNCVRGAARRERAQRTG